MFPNNSEGFRAHQIKARDLPDAWFQAVDLVQLSGRECVVEHGSYKGQKRKELDYVTIQITHPGTRPLVPEMPAHLSHIPPPTTMEYVEEYLPYLMSAKPPKELESYTYGQRVECQMEEIIRRFRRHGYGSNQECIAVACPEDLQLADPPCLRQIDCRIFRDDPALHFMIYFRSNDLWNGFPANLAALRLMQEYMADCIGVLTGQIIYSSKGLHLYDHVWDLAKERIGS